MFDKKKYVCWSCSHELDMTVRIQRRDECPSCEADLHVCKNCRFWDPGAHNECRESSTFYIREREAANFCMAFEFKTTTEADASEADNARAKLEAMFKK